MMKNKRLFGALVALLGSAAAVGSAFALYMGRTVPENKQIIIGTKVTGDVELHAAVVSDDGIVNNQERKLVPSSATPLSAEEIYSRTRTVKFSAGFTTLQGSAYAQAYYLARLDFSVTSNKAEFISMITPNSWIDMGCQTTENKTYSQYWADKDLNNHDIDPVAEGDQHAYLVNNDGKTITWSAYYPLFSGASISEFEMHMSLKEGITDAEYQSIAGATYTINFTVDKAEQLDDASTDPRIGKFQYAYVVGEATTNGGWGDKEDFRMVPNAMYNGFQWMFTDGPAGSGQKLELGKEFKLHNNGNWCHADGNHTWLEEYVGKTIYWSGENGVEFNIDA
jgi:hypothetical protein